MTVALRSLGERTPSELTNCRKLKCYRKRVSLKNELVVFLRE